MKFRWLLALVPLAVLLLCESTTAGTDTPASAAAANASDIPGWNALVDGLQALPAKLLAKLPADEQADPQIRAEVGRLMLAAVTSSALEILSGDGDHPALVPDLGQVLNLARPNADTVYLMADIAPGGTYRLRGRRGTLRMVEIGEVGPKVGPVDIYHDLNALHVDSKGRYDVILSPARPAAYNGDWWQLGPTTTRLMLRMVNDDWGKQQDPTFSIERLDRPVTRPRPSAAELTERLRRLPDAIAFIAGLRMGYVSNMRRQGYVDRFKVLDVSKMGGLVGQFYYESVYDLKDDEALILEAKEPTKCVYRSLIVTDEMGETVDWTDNETSLNSSQAKPDGDGILRIVVSAKDPGVPNWLDTAGYPQGLLQGRWTDCSSRPIPSVRKVAVAEVRKFLPPGTPTITPSEREHLIRERRAAYQQRPLW